MERWIQGHQRKNFKIERKLAVFSRTTFGSSEGGFFMHSPTKYDLLYNSGLSFRSPIELGLQLHKLESMQRRPLLFLFSSWLTS
jgi:hypothetical protein